MEFIDLLHYLSLPEEDYKEGTLTQIEVNVVLNRWEFYFSFAEVISLEKILVLIGKVEDQFKQYNPLIHLAYTNDVVPEDMMETYYQYVFEKSLKEFPRMESLNHFDKEITDLVRFSVPDEDSSSLVFEKINQLNYELKQLGVTIPFEVDVTEVGTSAKSMIEEQLTKIESGLTEEYEASSKKNHAQTKEIKRRPSGIRELPIEFEDFQKFAKDTLAIEGEVFAFDTRTFNGGSTLFAASIYDGTDSIQVKKFVRTRDANELKIYEQVLSVGNRVRVEGVIEYDQRQGQVYLQFEDCMTVEQEVTEVVDTAEVKRVELHLHTKMSAMDGITSIDEYVKHAIALGHDALAITDHNTVQAFPEFDHALHGKDLLPIYGAELSYVDDTKIKIAKGEKHLNLLDHTFVVFDVETTGLSVNHDDIIELSAVKIEHGAQVEFSRFISTNKTLTEFTKNLTGIQDADLMGAPSLKEVMHDFVNFIGSACLVAHNADFDMGFLYEALHKVGLYQGEYPVIDTLTMARVLYDGELKFFNLKSLSRFLKVELVEHHRAIYDARATADVFTKMRDEAYIRGVIYQDELNQLIDPELHHKLTIPSHITVLAKNRTGLVNLYKILSDASTVHFHREPRSLRTVIEAHREGLLIGSSCVNGEVFESSLNKDYTTLEGVVDFYDYLEVQPPESYRHLLETADAGLELEIKEAIKRIIRVGSEKNIPVCATGDVHHLKPEQVKYREIYIRTPLVGGGFHPLKRTKNIPSMHFRTTTEMMEAFGFVGDHETIQRIVVEEPRRIKDQIERFDLFPKELFTPKDDFFKEKGILSIRDEVTRMVWENAHTRYGKHLHEIIEKRIEQELTPIIDRGFANVYFISHLLVKNSLDAGYLVGSRGSVGSSFVATLMDITEVNPLPPHYVCPDCGFTLFKQAEVGFDARTQHLQDQLQEVDSGFDLPFANCPRCGQHLKGDGQDIPFATFLGFKGDKVPDIDLNFSGEYQSRAHEDIRRMFGAEYAFRAGTISTVQERTAFGYVKGYAKDHEIKMRDAEVVRQSSEIQGVRRSTGQHPGGIVVVPHETEIYNITPIQYPADDTSSSWRTTHFDYHSFESNLFKLDVLGHDDPTTLKVLMDYVFKYPDEFPFKSVFDIPVVDPKVIALFSGIDSLNIKQNIHSEIGTYGVPEFGTLVTRRLLSDTHPTSFSELVKISGLSHGTDVWSNNAKDLIEGNTPYGLIPFHDVIGCRDDIMIYLMYQGLDPADAYDITETARKTGKYLNDKQKNIMVDHGIPDWYIWSCDQIKYMFPKAHAVAYVMSALRIAWFKVHRPIYFYAAYFSVRADQFDLESMVAGYDVLFNKVSELKEKGMRATDVEKKTLTSLEIALEMVARGYSFKNIDLNKSLATEFLISDDKKSLILPFVTLQGLGKNVGDSITLARRDGDFTSVEDLKKRTRLSKTLIERMKDLHVIQLDDEDESQLSLF